MRCLLGADVEIEVLTVPVGDGDVRITRIRLVISKGGGRNELMTKHKQLQVSPMCAPLLYVSTDRRRCRTDDEEKSLVLCTRYLLVDRAESESRAE